MSRLEAYDSVAEVARARNTSLDRLEWRLTVNEYAVFPSGAQGDRSSQVVVFPWHTDIASNGDLTCIITLQHMATIEFMKHADAPNELFGGLSTEAAPHALLLEEGSALFSWGPSRHHCLHRVVATEPNPEHKSRLTLVLGCR